VLPPRESEADFVVFSLTFFGARCYTVEKCTAQAQEERKLYTKHKTGTRAIMSFLVSCFNARPQYACKYIYSDAAALSVFGACARGS
jgi:hypothetical protein